MTFSEKAQKLWDQYISKSDDMIYAGMGDFAKNLEDLVNTLLEAADIANDNIRGGDDIFDQVDLLLYAMDQVIESGSTFVPEMYVQFIQGLEQEAGDWSTEVKIPDGVLPEISNMMQQSALMNNYDMIQRIIPPLRNEIGQIFIDSVMEGYGPDEIERRLRNVGLDWSETGRYSPGQRAEMIAVTEYNRIRERMNDALGSAAELDLVYNELNMTLSSHASQCLAATAAGMISKDEMKSKYGMPPRHVRCGCHLQYTTKSYFDKDAWQSQLDELDNEGIDWQEKTNQWNEKGSLEEQNAAARREYEQNRNKFLDDMFGKGNKAA